MAPKINLRCAVTKSSEVSDVVPQKRRPLLRLVPKKSGDEVALAGWVLETGLGRKVQGLSATGCAMSFAPVAVDHGL